MPQERLRKKKGSVSPQNIKIGLLSSFTSLKFHLNLMRAALMKGIDKGISDPLFPSK